MTEHPNQKPYCRRITLAACFLVLLTGACDASAPKGAPVTELHPGTTNPYPDTLRQRLTTALVELGEGYEPRTHHLRDDGTPRWTNRLLFEDSPYLLQHAHNPVDWYPWGQEAFDKARAENKPIFLSIGYSTCHWCHVMERESFESEEVAAVMNELFVCIKVDRERRPDVDELYMTAVQMLNQRGGWPMSSFLTPTGEPFFGGTYYPSQQFVQLLQRAAATWRDQQAEVEESAHRLTEAVRAATAARGEARELAADVAETTVEQILSRYDAELGGFGRAPKFPHEPELLFLLGRAARGGETGERGASEDSRSSLPAMLHTLEAMARGGIYDQVGGGFHRYSTDAHWLVPHFEKMLYNQAHLARAYALAYRLTGSPFYHRIARQTLDYVKREMTSPDGAFYSATDADSEGEEGIFFVWTPEQLDSALGAEDAAFARRLWAVEPGGNFEGHSILHLPVPTDELAATAGVDHDAFLSRVDTLRERLWQIREEREHPLRDDKILTAWNGMMITAFADAGRLFGSETDIETARRAADFLWRVAWSEDSKTLWRVRLGASASVTGLQEDYAYLAEALVALFDATAEPSWLERARAVADAMIEYFWDEEHGGFFMGAADADPNLIARPKSPGDGATPSGNSVAVRALAQLARRTGEPGYRDKAEATAAAFADSIQRLPLAYPYLLLGLSELESGGDTLEYGAGGKLRVKAELEPLDGGYTLRLDLELAKGWHVNAHQIEGDELIPTALELGPRGGLRIAIIDYPEGETVRLGFQDEPLKIYQGKTRIVARLENDTEPTSAPELPLLDLRLRAQACDESHCLRPETLRLAVPLPRTMGSSTPTRSPIGIESVDE